MNVISKTTVLILCTLFFISCKKTKVGSTLPHISSEGKNYFAYYLDDEAYIMYGLKPWRGLGITLFDATGIDYNISRSNIDSLFHIDIDDYGLSDFNLYFYLKSVEGYHNLNELWPTQEFRFHHNDLAGYRLNTEKENFLNVQRNAASNSISGNFQIHFINDNQNEKVITDGRYDFGPE